MNKTRNPNLLLSDAAYEAVRDAIFANEFKPGDRVSEYMVAERLNISRTPAREGLRRLEADGLLTSHPRRGLVVASIDEDAIHELYAVRELLEGAAAAMAARHATDSEINQFKRLAEAESHMLNDPDQMFEHNLRFHQLLYRASHNRYLMKYLLSIADTLSAYRSTSTLVSGDRRKTVVQEHRELCNAIAKRDESAAKNAAVKHIQSALRARVKVQQDALIGKVQRRSKPLE